MARFAQYELSEELAKYDDGMKERDTLLSAFHSLLHIRSSSSRGDFLAKVSDFVTANVLLLRHAFAVRQTRFNPRSPRSTSSHELEWTAPYSSRSLPRGE